MDEKSTVYLETTIPSYLTGRRTKDILIVAKQLLTRTWWESSRHAYSLVISNLVLLEASLGDPSAAARRIECLKDIPVLPSDHATEALVTHILKTSLFPLHATADAAHIAIAAKHGINFLLTWNCRHIANANIFHKVQSVIEAAGFRMPIICTPEELSWNQTL